VTSPEDFHGNQAGVTPHPCSNPDPSFPDNDSIAADVISLGQEDMLLDDLGSTSDSSASSFSSAHSEASRALLRSQIATAIEQVDTTSLLPEQSSRQEDLLCDEADGDQSSDLPSDMEALLEEETDEEAIAAYFEGSHYQEHQDQAHIEAFSGMTEEEINRALRCMKQERPSSPELTIVYEQVTKEIDSSTYLVTQTVVRQKSKSKVTSRVESGSDLGIEDNELSEAEALGICCPPVRQVEHLSDHDPGLETCGLVVASEPSLPDAVSFPDAPEALFVNMPSELPSENLSSPEGLMHQTHVHDKEVEEEHRGLLSSNESVNTPEPPDNGNSFQSDKNEVEVDEDACQDDSSVHSFNSYLSEEEQTATPPKLTVPDPPACPLETREHISMSFVSKDQPQSSPMCHFESTSDNFKITCAKDSEVLLVTQEGKVVGGTVKLHKKRWENAESSNTEVCNLPEPVLGCSYKPNALSQSYLPMYSLPAVEIDVGDASSAASPANSDMLDFQTQVALGSQGGTSKALFEPANVERIQPSANKQAPKYLRTNQLQVQKSKVRKKRSQRRSTRTADVYELRTSSTDEDEESWKPSSSALAAKIRYYRLKGKRTKRRIRRNDKKVESAPGVKRRTKDLCEVLDKESTNSSPPPSLLEPKITAKRVLLDAEEVVSASPVKKVRTLDYTQDPAQPTSPELGANVDTHEVFFEDHFPHHSPPAAEVVIANSLSPYPEPLVTSSVECGSPPDTCQLSPAVMLVSTQQLASDLDLPEPFEVDPKLPEDKEATSCSPEPVKIDWHTSHRRSLLERLVELSSYFQEAVEKCDLRLNENQRLEFMGLPKGQLGPESFILSLALQSLQGEISASISLCITVIILIFKK
jgi:hypothetical protein